MSRKNHTHRPTNTRGAARRRTLALAAAALTLAVTGIAATAWLTSAQESTRVTSTHTANSASSATAGVTAQNAASASQAQPTTATATATKPAQPPTATSANTSSAATQPTVQQPAAPAQAAPFTAGQRAFIDPVTGELRQPEHEELAAIAAAASAAAQSRRSARTAGATASFAPESFGPDGSIEAVVPEDLHTFTVATRGADGRISIEHAQGANEAVKVINANSAKHAQAPVSRAKAKEDRNDR